MPGPIQSIERAAAVLRLLSGAGQGLGVVDVGNALGLAKTTAHGILRTLVDVGFVEQDEAGDYRASPGLADLGRPRIDANDLRAHAVNWTDSLASRTGESVKLATLVDGRALVVHHVFRPDDSAQELLTGTSLPAHACALGKVLLASAPVRPRGRLSALTARTTVDAAALRRTLAAVREQGWALDVEELAEGAAGIAAPVRDRGGLVVGAVGIDGDADRLVDTRGRPRAGLVPAVCQAARSISRGLGSRAD
ncbi:helix-turn-helix domain-containing protein [Kineococcus sp. T13]|uniref:IclR family transcriptional regulator domain-containing protein n=1 Tax=Kineococcus vitellinus TaxID=2696565 RepID=UPI001413182F|nr:helix-turn-helix domain-containing protein [Kineococcus vitellinus]